MSDESGFLEVLSASNYFMFKKSPCCKEEEYEIQGLE
jgi:hypothetical protein